MSAGRESKIPLPDQLVHLLAKYHLKTGAIRSNSAISQVVGDVVTLLARPGPDDKPGIFIIDGRPGVSNKVITIAEVAKRAIAENGGVYYQYTSCTSEVVEVKNRKDIKMKAPEASGIESSGAAGNDVRQSEDEEAFESMAVVSNISSQAKPKIRAVPSMKIFMSSFPVPELKALYRYKASSQPMVR
jgi:hypothetical protein